MEYVYSGRCLLDLIIVLMKKHPLISPYVLDKKVQNLVNLPFFKTIKIPDDQTNFIDFLILMNSFTQGELGSFIECICCNSYCFIEDPLSFD